MKICVLGLDSADPEIIFQDERLLNLRRLMEMGAYGMLESIAPPTTIPAWMSMVTSLDPASLGVKTSVSPETAAADSRDRAIANAASTDGLAIWDHLALEGKRAVIIGVPPNSPPRPLNGISIACYLTPNPVKNVVWPPEFESKLTELVGQYPTDVSRTGASGPAGSTPPSHLGDFPGNQQPETRNSSSAAPTGPINSSPINKDALRDEIFRVSAAQWQVIRWLLTNEPWDYFHFVDIGLRRIQECFSNSAPQPPATLPAADPRSSNPFPSDSPTHSPAVSEYYLALDERIGSVLELFDDQTVALVMSANGPPQLPAAPDNSTRARHGFFILAAPNSPLSGEIEGAHLLDLAPTLLDLAGHKISAIMQGRSLLAGRQKKDPNLRNEDEAKLLHDRLSGLGYV